MLGVVSAENAENVAIVADRGSEYSTLVEEDTYLPLDVDGTRAMISRIIDLVHVLPDRVAVVDYKTGRGRHAEAEY